MSLDYINKLLAALPSYMEITIRFRMGDEEREHRLMTRDMPGDDRRLTNLTSGTEWFLPLSNSLEIISVVIPPMTVVLV